ncbi:MAG: discoidin domain-containing protein [Candidatus Brocadiia bacterium]
MPGHDARWRGLVAALLLVAGLSARAAGGDKVPLELELPDAVYEGTPKTFPLTPYMEKPSEKPRKPILVPEGVENVARGKPVTASVELPAIGELDMVTDGDKRGSHESYVELPPGPQWVQIDLEAPYRLHAIVLWHYHIEARVYHDVVVRVADDADFITGVRTVYSNDYDNSLGLGIGKAKEYFEDNQGRLIELDGIEARYVRLYSNGSTAGDRNHVTEVEVYGLPAR